MTIHFSKLVTLFQLFFVLTFDAMTKTPLTVTIITHNEEKNIANALKSVAWASEIIVVDSGSGDKTQKISKDLGATVFENPWIGYGQQKNFAHSKATNEWVLNIDADEIVSTELKNEIIQTIEIPHNPNCGYFIPRKTFFSGQWIKNGGWYPNYLLRLSRKNASKWTEPHLHESLTIQGAQDYLTNPLEHYTFHKIEDQVIKNLRYAQHGATELIRMKKKITLLHIIFKPIGKFLETYIIKRGFLDGFLGFTISINAAYSMFLKYTFAFEKQNMKDSTQ